MRGSGRVFLLGLTAALVLGFSLVLAPISPALAVDKILCGSTATTSSHYVYTVSAGKSINATVGDKLNVTVVATGGAVDNLERINRGQLNMGIGTWATFYQAYHGIGKYKGKARPKMRALWLYSVNTQNYVVRADSKVSQLTDLSGNKFCPGLRGSATEQLVQQLLGKIAVKPKYFRGSLSDAVAAVKDDRISGYVKAGAGLDLDASTKELKAFTNIKVLGWSPAQVAVINKDMPFVNFITVPEGKIKGVPSYTTVAQSIGVIAYYDSLTEEQAYLAVKGIIEGKKYQEAAYPQLKGFNIPAMTMELTKIPLHVGAIKYYREQGIKVPEALIPPEAK